MISSRISTASSILDTSCPEDEQPAISWANRVKGQAPLAFKPRNITEAQADMVFGNNDMTGKFLVFFLEKSLYEISFNKTNLLFACCKNSKF